MTIKPLDIQQQNFPVAFRGYDREEVTEFLELVGQHVETLIRANLELAQRVEGLEEKLESVQVREDDLRAFMATAHQSNDTSTAQAKEEAKLIKREAELKANELIAEANERASETLEEIAELNRNKTRLKSSIRSLLDMYGRLLEEDAMEAERFSLRSPDDVRAMGVEVSPEALASNQHISSIVASP